MTAMNNQEMFKKVITDTVTCFLTKESYQLASSTHFKSISTTQITAGDKNSPFRMKRAEARQGFHGFFCHSSASLTLNTKSWECILLGNKSNCSSSQGESGEGCLLGIHQLAQNLLSFHFFSFYLFFLNFGDSLLQPRMAWNFKDALRLLFFLPLGPECWSHRESCEFAGLGIKGKAPCTQSSVPHSNPKPPLCGY